jgi:hypothetical protein
VLIRTLMFGVSAMLIPQKLSPAKGMQFTMSCRCYTIVPLKVSSQRLIPCSIHDIHWALNTYRLPNLSFLYVLNDLVTSLSLHVAGCLNTSCHFHLTESWLVLICMDLWSIVVVDLARFSNQFSTYRLTLRFIISFSWTVNLLHGIPIRTVCLSQFNYCCNSSVVFKHR